MAQQARWLISLNGPSGAMAQRARWLNRLDGPSSSMAWLIRLNGSSVTKFEVIVGHLYILLKSGFLECWCIFVIQLIFNFYIFVIFIQVLGYGKTKTGDR